jgi:hypothetical protein
VIVPAAVAVAQFCRFYPGLYRDPAYPTRDRVVPFARFWTLHQALTAVMALERVSMARAIGHALGQVFAKDRALPQPLADDLVTAFLQGED